MTHQKFGFNLLVGHGHIIVRRSNVAGTVSTAKVHSLTADPTCQPAADSVFAIFDTGQHT